MYLLGFSTWFLVAFTKLILIYKRVNGKTLYSLCNKQCHEKQDTRFAQTIRAWHILLFPNVSRFLTRDRSDLVSVHPRVVGDTGLHRGRKVPLVQETPTIIITHSIAFALIVYIPSQYQNIYWRQSKFVSRHSAKCFSLFFWFFNRTCTCPICCLLRFQIRSLLQFSRGGQFK